MLRRFRVDFGLTFCEMAPHGTDKNKKLPRQGNSLPGQLFTGLGRNRLSA